MKKSITLLSVLISISLFGQCPKKDVRLNTQTEVDTFKENYPNCTRLETRLTISGSDINNLSGLSNLEAIGGYLDISYNDNLSNLSGLENLNKVYGYLRIKSNPSLSSLSGLENLQNIGRDLHINDNDALVNLKGLDNLITIDRDLDILNNNSITSLSGLNNLNSVGGFFDIKNNSSLSSLSGIDNLEATGGYLQVKANPRLTDLTGLDNLQSIGGVLVILDNSSLNSLSGLDNVKTLVGYVDPNLKINGSDNENYQDINIKNNPVLSNCAIKSICKFIAKGKTTDIQNNASTCDSHEEIYKECGALSVNNLNNSSSDVKIYPNPTNDFVNIQTNDSIEKVEIYSITGKLLKVINSTNQISINKYPAGVYIFVIYSDRGAYEQKIIKK